MFSKLKLRGRLSLAVAPLIILALVLSGFLVNEQITVARHDQEMAVLAEVWQDVTSIAALLESVQSQTSVAGSADEILKAYEELEADLGTLGDTTALALVQSSREALATFYAGENIEQDDRVAHEVALDLLFGATATFPGLAINDHVAAHFEALGYLAEVVTAAEEAKRLAVQIANGEITSDIGVPLFVVIDLQQHRAFDLLFRTLPPDEIEELQQFDLVGRHEEVERLFEVVLETEGSSDADAELVTGLIKLQTNATEAQNHLNGLIVADAEALASQARLNAIALAGVVILVLLMAAFVTVGIITSVSRRVSRVAAAALRTAEHQLPALVQALRDPNSAGELPEIPVLADSGHDEIAELAQSFGALQATLQEVAGCQMDTLQKGVSEIFVTLARRNRSLVDRQLATLDQLERNEEDPARLNDYYKLDHMATRMRRNAESLLVLAGTESPRRWKGSFDIGDVIRAAIGEVEDYQRIDILATEPLDIVGSAVSDIAHLLSELLDNATSFSPPDSRVRVTGHFDPSGYLLSISDRGMGVTDERRSALNRLLKNPPIMGLALDATLGMYVVAKLASRHGVKVRIVSGHPGTIVQILLTKSVFAGVEPANGPVFGDDLALSNGHRSEPDTAYGSVAETVDHVGAGELELVPVNGGSAASPASSQSEVAAEAAATKATSPEFGSPPAADSPEYWGGSQKEREQSTPPTETPSAPPGDDYWGAPPDQPRVFAAPSDQGGATNGMPPLPTRQPMQSPDRPGVGMPSPVGQRVDPANSVAPPNAYAGATQQAPVPNARLANGLPVRSPGASYTGGDGSDAVARTGQDPEDIRKRLSAFQSSQQNRTDSGGTS